jgi:amino acid permease
VFPIFCVAYLCHFNVLPIHGDLIIPSRHRIKGVIHSTIGLCTALYFVIGLLGYMVDYEDTEDDILNNFADRDPAMTVGRIGLAITLLSSFPLLILPARTNLHQLVANAFKLSTPGTGPESKTDAMFRIGETIFLVALSLSAASGLKTVVTVWNFLGSTLGLLVSFILPPLFYLKIRKPHFKSSMTVPAWLLLIFGIVSLIVCTVNAFLSVL